MQNKRREKKMGRGEEIGCMESNTGVRTPGAFILARGVNTIPYHTMPSLPFAACLVFSCSLIATHLIRQREDDTTIGTQTTK
eukprot:6187683-Pleurochrysis_carterae.AAC.1